MWCPKIIGLCKKKKLKPVLYNTPSVAVLCSPQSLICTLCSAFYRKRFDSPYKWYSPHYILNVHLSTTLNTILNFLICSSVRLLYGVFFFFFHFRLNFIFMLHYNGHGTNKTHHNILCTLKFEYIFITNVKKVFGIMLSRF